MSADPGLDLHVWETEMALLEDDLRTSPVDALPQLVDLVHRLLVERGYAPDETARPDDPEIVGDFRQARDLVRSEALGDGEALGDAGDAVQRLMRIYRLVLEERPAP